MLFVKKTFKAITDFVFFHKSDAEGSNNIFDSFLASGLTCEFVDEKSIQEWQPNPKRFYQAAVVSTNEPEHLKKINSLLDNGPKSFTKCFLIQHDNSDNPDVESWTNREPNLIMKKELWKGTKAPKNIPIEPFHCAVGSMYDESFEQINDVMFYGEASKDFTDKVIELSTGSLKNLKWDISIGEYNSRDEGYKKSLNSCKVALHYFNGSRDSERIWQIASTRAALIMPKMRTFSVLKEYMPFEEYVTISDNFCDLESKILKTLDSWEILGKRSQISFKNKHSCRYVSRKYRDIVKLWMGPRWKDGK